jgi:acyl-CoA synthetase (AMP-forming)/AMP-acid ligase II
LNEFLTRVSENATQRPDTVAVRYLDATGKVAHTLTNAGLEQSTALVSAALRKRRVTRVAIALTQGPDLLIALLSAMRAQAVPYLVEPGQSAPHGALRAREIIRAGAPDLIIGAKFSGSATESVNLSELLSEPLRPSEETPQKKIRTAGRVHAIHVGDDGSSKGN